MTDNQKLLYLAGIMDGEGHFCVTPLKNGQGKIYPIARMIVNQKDVRLCEWLKATYGGSIYTYQTTTSTITRWELRGQQVKELAIRLQPYLIVKKEQVLRVIEGVNNMVIGKRLSVSTHDAKQV